MTEQTTPANDDRLPASESTVPEQTTSAPAPAAPAPRPRRRLLLGAAIGVGALLVVAATAGITAAIVDDGDDEDRDSASQVLDGAEPGREGQGGDRQGDHAGSAAAPDATPVPAAGAVAAGVRPATAAEFEAARDAALALAEGERVIEIDRTRDGGYSVEVVLADGSDVDVLLDSALAEVRLSAPDAEDPDDRPVGSLAGEGIERLVAAALAETGTGGVIALDATGEADDVDVYSVEVLQEDGTRVEIDFDAQLAVVGIDTDRPGED